MGVGGIGVHGIGGSQSEPTWNPNDPPGTGVLAQGGRQAEFNKLRLPHGAGVVAIAAGSKQPIPPIVDGSGMSVTGGVGVYAQGAEAKVETLNIDGVPTVVGPTEPGPGVLGRGGVPIPRDRAVAAGVIGLAGDVPIQPFLETGNTGVYGKGPIGVHGRSDAGPGVEGSSGKGIGVIGQSDSDRGGLFSSGRSAQVLLQPFDLHATLPAPVPITATAIPSPQEGPKLPRDGRGGDLMAVIDKKHQCTLWFCVGGAIFGPDGIVLNPASWAQVLLGPSFIGVA
jgi:hypothetical protein